VIILETLSVKTKSHVTLHAFEYHRSLHAPRWSHVISAFRLTASRPVLIVTCVKSSDVSRSLGWFPYRHRQHTSPFRTRYFATLQFQQNFSTANASNSKISTEESRTPAECLVVWCVDQVYSQFSPLKNRYSAAC